MNYSATGNSKNVLVYCQNKPVTSEDKLVHYLKRNEKQYFKSPSKRSS
jgi:hypothetical protein